MNVDYVTTQPLTQTVNAGVSVTLAAASSNGGINGDDVQWQVSTNNGSSFTDIAGATSTTYTFTPTAATTITSTRRSSKTRYSSFPTNAATLTVDFAHERDHRTPANQTANVGDSVNFSVAANANPAATVQWQVSTDGGQTFNNISGATSDTYSLTAASSQSGDEYQAIVTNTLGTVTTTRRP